MSTMNGRQKFRSSVVVVKTALRFLLKSEGKTLELSHSKRKWRRGIRPSSESLSFAGVPDAPSNVRLMVTGANHITVTFDEPLRSNGVLVIKYKSKLFLSIKFVFVRTVVSPSWMECRWTVHWCDVRYHQKLFPSRICYSKFTGGTKVLRSRICRQYERLRANSFQQSTLLRPIE